MLRLILIGYLHEGGPERTTLGPASVGKAVGVDATVVSRNNEFLAALGLVETERLGRSRLTEAGARVARAFERQTEPELSRALSPLLQEDDFVRRVLTYVGSRGAVDRYELEHHVARAAGPPRNQEFPTGASALVDLILAAGLLVDDRGTIRMNGGVGGEATAVGAALEPSQAALAPSPDEAGTDPRATRDPAPVQRQVIVTLNLTAADLESDAAVDLLAARIKRLLDSVDDAPRPGGG